MERDQASHASGGAQIVEFRSHEPDPAADRLDRRLADARAFADAADGLSERRPEFSARSGLWPGQRAGLWAAFGAAVVFGVRAPAGLAAAILAIMSAVFSLVIALRLAAALAALIDRRKTTQDPPDADLPTLTYLVPLYREANMAEHIVAALAALDYPQHLMDAKLLVEADDADTIAALRALALPGRFEILPVPRGLPRTKPKALNYGLAYATGEIVAVLDAEDLPAAGQAREAARALRQGGERVSVVQAPLSIYNGERAWIARQSEIEYAAYFGAWLPMIDRIGWPLLLGGTSNYFRRAAVIDAGGWDAWNVTEDADLGLRLARLGYRGHMLTAPTREEAPIRFAHWLDQRTRWIKGHMQTWFVLMRQPMTALRQLGPWRYLGAQAALGGSLLAHCLHGPLLAWAVLAMLSLAPSNGFGLTLLGAGYGSVVLSALAVGGLRGRLWALATLPLYWPLLTLAMARAMWELRMKPHFWAKTPHGVARKRD